MTGLRELFERPGVTRVWPGKKGTLAFEWVDDEGRLRAGSASASGVTLLDHGTDPALPGLSPDRPGAIVVHRYGRRAVAVTPDTVTKYTRAGHAAPVVHSSRRFAELCSRAGIATPEVLGHDDARIEFARAPGVSLHDLGDAGIEGWRRFVEAWPTLAGGEADLPSHSAEGEAATLARWHGLALEHGAIPRDAALDRAVEEVCADLSAHDDGPVGVIHRDLHDKQLLWDGERLTLLDLDLGSRGEIAQDLGNALAHAEVRRRQGVLSAEGLTRMVDLLGGAVTALDANPARVVLHRRAARLRIGFVHAFRPADQSWLLPWLAECAARTHHHDTLERTLS